MERCPFCQGELDPNSHRCQKCGRTVPAVPSIPLASAAAVEETASLRCPNCGAAMPADARFCGACGTSFNLSPEKAKAVSAAQPVQPLAASAEQKTQAVLEKPAEPASEKDEPSLFSHLAKFWRGALAFLATVVTTNIASIVLGFAPEPDSFPPIKAIMQHPVISLLIGIILSFITIASFLVGRTPKQKNDNKAPAQKKAWRLPHWVLSTSISTISFTLFLSLLGVVLIRPAWCPTEICPAAQILTRPDSTRDANLEIYFSAIQSSYYTIPGDPASYSLSNLPENIAALRIDQQATFPPYRVAVGIHSLQQSGFSMVIEDVALVGVNAPPTPRPLNVWLKGESRDYNRNLFRVVYNGQPTGFPISATYEPLPAGHVQLRPGEADELDLQIASRLLIDLQFQVQVTYRIANETAEHVLKLSNHFEAIFSDASNWHLYQLQNGHLVPSL